MKNLAGIFGSRYYRLNQVNKNVILGRLLYTGAIGSNEKRGGITDYR